jgi:penicillin-binding protein 2
MAVMVENGGSGSGTAAPMARKVADYWLLGKLPDAGVPVDSHDPEEGGADMEVTDVEAADDVGSGEEHP